MTPSTTLRMTEQELFANAAEALTAAKTAAEEAEAALAALTHPYRDDARSSDDVTVMPWTDDAQAAFGEVLQIEHFEKARKKSA